MHQEPAENEEDLMGSGLQLNG